MVRLAESASELSCQPDTLSQLTHEQQQRLTDELDRVLCALEQGEAVNVDQFTLDNPDLRDVFAEYLEKLEALFGVAIGFQHPGSDLEAIPSNLKQLGEFTMLREIGRGGMGVVYEAHQQSLDRKVAIKLLPMSSLLDQRQIARFKNEAHAAGLLQHPSIVPVYSVGAENGIHFYAMQLIQGCSIDAWIQERADALSCEGACQTRVPACSGSDWRTVVQWIIDVAEAIHAAHELGIIHRDVKPSNLLLDTTGKIWITDFGLARCQHERSLTLSGDMVGTIRYMSPEQASGKNETVDHRTDVYSLAATLFEMLALRPAIVGEDGPSLLRVIAQDDPPRLNDWCTEAPRDLTVVLQKAMAKRKDDRYESAQQFADDLRRVTLGQATIAQPPTMAQWVTQWMRRHRRMMMIAAAVLLLATIGTTTSTILLRHQVIQTQYAEQRADLHFRAGHHTVQRLGTEVAEQLASIPGTEHVRQSLLTQTLAYYEQFAATAKDDPKLQAELAVTHSQIGSLVRELRSPAAAIPHYQQAAVIFATMLDTGSPEIELRAAENLNLLALALVDVGRREEALGHYQQGLAIQRSLAKASPDNIRYATELAVTTNNYGLLLRELNRANEATQALQDSVAHLQQLAQANPENELVARGLSAALANLASLFLDRDPSAAIELFQQSLRHRLATIGQSSNRLRASAELAAIYNNLGSAEFRAERFSNSETSFASAIRLLEQLHLIAPEVPQYQIDLAMSLNNLAIAQQKQGKHHDAIGSVTEALKYNTATATGSLVSRERQAAMQHNLATSLVALKKYDRAEHALRIAIELQSDVVELAGETQRGGARQLLLKHYSDLLRCQVRAGRWSELDTTVMAYRQAAGDDASLLGQVTDDVSEVERLRPKSRGVSSSKDLTMTQGARR